MNVKAPCLIWFVEIDLCVILSALYSITVQTEMAHRFTRCFPDMVPKDTSLFSYMEIITFFFIF